MVQSSRMRSASPLLCGVYYKQAIHIFKYIKGWPLPPSACRRSHKLRSMCRSQKMRLSLERQDLNTAGRRAFPPSRPGEPAGFSAPGCLVYFYKRCLSSNAGWAIILGRPSVSVSVCCSLGEERGCGRWPLAQKWGRAAPAASPPADTAALVHRDHLWRGKGPASALFAGKVKEKKNCWSLLLHLYLCFEGCNSENMYFSAITYSCLHAYDT